MISKIHFTFALKIHIEFLAFTFVVLSIKKFVGIVEIYLIRHFSSCRLQECGYS